MVFPFGQKTGQQASSAQGLAEPTGYVAQACAPLPPQQRHSKAVIATRLGRMLRARAKKNAEPSRAKARCLASSRCFDRQDGEEHGLLKSRFLVLILVLEKGQNVIEVLIGLLPPIVRDPHLQEQEERLWDAVIGLLAKQQVGVARSFATIAVVLERKLVTALHSVALLCAF
jgi:hypothetical protein